MEYKFTINNLEKVGVRFLDMSNTVQLNYAMMLRFSWGFQQGNLYTKVPNTEVDILTPDGYISVIVQGNKFTALYNGEIVTTAFIDGFPTGKAAIFLQPINTIEEFKVTSLP